MHQSKTKIMCISFSAKKQWSTWTAGRWDDLDKSCRITILITHPAQLFNSFVFTFLADDELTHVCAHSSSSLINTKSASFFHFTFLQDVYSRVGRVCKNDEGGPHTFRNKWTTFLKTRLNCSVPGSYPFYFDQIQSMSQLIRTKNEDVVFGVFNTPENSITGSAVCSFKMSDIRDSFNGPFKAQSDVNSNWLPLAKHQVPATRPGSCHNNSRSLGEEHLNFLKENTLMDQAVPSSINIPHFIKTSPHERLTTIAVDPAVPTSQGETADVLFVGTTRGRVLKMASYQYEGVPKTTLIEELQVFPLHVSVSNILIVRSGAEPRVVVLSKHEVKSLPVARCHSTNIQSCGECVAMQDPYCAWNVKNQRCQSLQGSSEDTSSLLQNIGEGHHPGCPPVSLTNSGNCKEIQWIANLEEKLLLFSENHFMLQIILFQNDHILKMAAGWKQMTRVQRKYRQLAVAMVTFKIYFQGIFLWIVSLNSIVSLNGCTNDFSQVHSEPTERTCTQRKLWLLPAHQRDW